MYCNGTEYKPPQPYYSIKSTNFQSFRVFNPIPQENIYSFAVWFERAYTHKFTHYGCLFTDGFDSVGSYLSATLLCTSVTKNGIVWLMNVAVPYIQSLRKEFTFFLGDTILVCVWVYFAHTCAFIFVYNSIVECFYIICLGRVFPVLPAVRSSYVRATEFEERRRLAEWNWIDIEN